MQLTESPQKEEVRMNTEGHVKGSKRSHKQMERSAKAVGKKEMSDEEFEREMAELKAHLSILEEVLQKYEEDQKYG